jgi:hypothetical protein
MEYPTGSVRIQYTTVSVRFSSGALARSLLHPEKPAGRRKIQQIPVSNCSKDRYNLAERAPDPKANPEMMCASCETSTSTPP